MNIAASFWAQLRLYVACSILKRVVEVTKLDQSYTDEIRTASLEELWALFDLDQEIDADINRECRKYSRGFLDQLANDRKYAYPRFILTAGSYAWAGSFPPHSTHKSGDAFDISMGPRLPNWPSLRAKEFLLVAYPILLAADKMKLSEMKAAKIKGGEFKGVDDFLEIHQSPKDWCYEKTAASKKELNKFVYKRIDELIGQNPRTKDGQQAFEEAIERLKGFPNFTAKKEAELAHVGHLCLMIAKPRQLIYASPVIHIRAMRALYYALNGVDEREGGNQRMFAQIAKEITAPSSRGGIRSYVFEPTAHHHHWHIDYSNEQVGQESKLWLRLMVDLRPFLDYLIGLRNGGYLRSVPSCDNEDDPLQSQEPLAQQSDFCPVLSFCNQYVEEFNELYGNSPQGELQSNELVDEMFHWFIMTGPGYIGEWLTPTVPEKEFDKDISQRLLDKAHLDDVLDRILRAKGQEWLEESGKKLQEQIPEKYALRKEILAEIIRDWGMLGKSDKGPQDLRNLIYELYSRDEFVEIYGRIEEEEVFELELQED